MVVTWVPWNKGGLVNTGPKEMTERQHWNKDKSSFKELHKKEGPKQLLLI